MAVFSYPRLGGLRPPQLSADEHICGQEKRNRSGKLRCVETRGTTEENKSTEPEILREGEMRVGAVHTRTEITAKRDQQFSSTKTNDEDHTPVYGRHDLQTPKKGTYCSFSSSERHDTVEQGKARIIQ